MSPLLLLTVLRDRHEILFCCSFSCVCSGMEALIRSQRENMAEFEAAIAANKDEITKVRILNVQYIVHVHILYIYM